MLVKLGSERIAFNEFFFFLLAYSQKTSATSLIASDPHNELPSYVSLLVDKGKKKAIFTDISSLCLANLDLSLEYFLIHDQSQHTRAYDRPVWKPLWFVSNWR